MHGPAKITWVDNSTVISKFKNGYLHGYTRTWNSQGTLIKAGYHTKGIENGSHWRVNNNHLMFVNSEMLNDDSLGENDQVHTVKISLQPQLNLSVAKLSLAPTTIALYLVGNQPTKPN